MKQPERAPHRARSPGGLASRSGLAYSEYVPTVCEPEAHRLRSPREEMAMTWTTFHRRGEVLRSVTTTVDTRLDGLLPMDVSGVRETFGDEVSLIAALKLGWHTRLSGHVERALMHQPTDLDAAVIGAWHTAVAEL